MHARWNLNKDYGKMRTSSKITLSLKGTPASDKKLFGSEPFAAPHPHFAGEALPLLLVDPSLHAFSRDQPLHFDGPFSN